MKNLARIAAAFLAVTALSVPAFAQRGSANFNRFVALGDSYGAGVSSGSLNERHQHWSWPAIIARQAGAVDFQQPLVSFPGIGNELQIVNIASFPPVIQPAPGQGQPINLALARPYNNLSIPGATVRDLHTLTGAQQPTRTPEQFAQFILRASAFPQPLTAVQQAVALQPTFIAMWIGGNDFLGAVLSGSPAGLTSVEQFRTSYTTVLDTLVAGAPNAGIVVGNLPTSTNIPVVNTVQPVIINPATRQPLLIGGNPVFLFADLGGGNLGQLPPGSRVLLTASGDVASGYGIPPQLATQAPFNQLPNAGKPLADRHVITPDEMAAITARVAEYNTVINQLASQRNIPVADINGLFNRWTSTTTPYRVGPITLSSAYITGGIFSLDGFHLTDIGYLLFANEYIRTINEAYDTDIPLASITQLFANNGAFFPNEDGDSARVTLSPAAEAQILSFATPPAKRGRFRAATH
ncbi:MAG TPA: SGNH/GDSL hydrolase family protein [Thermoanaerobaculia bacterium]